MALFKCGYRSTVLAGNINFNVIVPEQCTEDTPVVYLLHGVAGNQEDWIRFTSIERYAAERSLAVVMPSVTKSNYTDQKYGLNYYTFVTEELVNYTKRFFGLSKKREKTFVAGLSMGGYGSFKIGLSKPELFAGAASLSGTLERRSFYTPERPITPIDIANYGENVNEVFPHSDNDIIELIERIERDGKPKPWLFQACGTDDGCYQNNLRFKDYIQDKGFTYKYCEGPGAHTWDVWDHWIPHALDFFCECMKENGVEDTSDKSYTSPIVRK